MGEIRWYKRDPDAALNGMMELSLEERGAYNTVLDLIYSRDGKLPEDDRFIAGWLRVDVRVWKRIKTRLIDAGKLYLRDGLLRNSRADVEVLSALHRVGSARDAGRASAKSRSHKSHNENSKNKDLGGTDAATDRQRPFEQPTTTPRIREEEETNVSPSSSAGEGADRPKRSSRARRSVGVDTPIPDGWEPSLGPAAQRIVDGWPPGMLDREAFAFRSHAVANGRLAKNWDAAFGTWISRAEGRRAEHGNRGQAANGYGGGPDRRSNAERAVDRELERGRAERLAREAGRHDAGGIAELVQLPLAGRPAG